MSRRRRTLAAVIPGSRVFHLVSTFRWLCLLGCLASLAARAGALERQNPQRRFAANSLEYLGSDNDLLDSNDRAAFGPLLDDVLADDEDERLLDARRRQQQQPQRPPEFLAQVGRDFLVERQRLMMPMVAEWIESRHRDGPGSSTTTSTTTARTTASGTTRARTASFLDYLQQQRSLPATLEANRLRAARARMRTSVVAQKKRAPRARQRPQQQTGINGAQAQVSPRKQSRHVKLLDPTSEQHKYLPITGENDEKVSLIECPLSTDGMERFGCPTPDRNGRHHCIDDYMLCDGYKNCPGGEDEDRKACMFHQTTKAYLDMLAEALLRWAKG